MKAEPRWLSKKALLLLHEESLATFGGASGLRDDEGLLDSAVARPQNTHAYNADSTRADLAASYAFGIAKNHALVDGNKRAAFLSIGVFLAINGLKLATDPLDAIHTMMAVAAGDLDERGLSAWIQKNCVPR